MWTEPEAKGISKPTGIEAERLKLLADGCDTSNIRRDSKDIMGEVSKTRDVIHVGYRTLDKTISNLEMELAAARAVQDSIVSGTTISDDLRLPEPVKKRKYLMVIGINTAFSSRRRRDFVRATWRPQCCHLWYCDVICDMSQSTSGGILDRAIEAEEKKHGDFLRLEHTEGTLGATLSRYQSKPRVYIGCMKSGPVLAHKLLMFLRRLDNVLMLSGESAMGSYGQKAIFVLRMTSARMELWGREENHQSFLPQIGESLPDQVAEQICSCACQMGTITFLIIYFYLQLLTKNT
ncbi:putative pyruvate kinase [Helianthus debilis subsp. tardiflorus]